MTLDVVTGEVVPLTKRMTTAEAGEAATWLRDYAGRSQGGRGLRHHSRYQTANAFQGGRRNVGTGGGHAVYARAN